MNVNLTAEQKDYAVFLPAVSGFYATFIGKQQSTEYVETSRIPQNFNNCVESLNLLNPKEGQFQYKWCLYSAGHADLDITRDSPKEDMFRKRDRATSWALGDSGGFQMAKVCGKVIGRTSIVLKHLRKENKYLLGWMHIWTME